MSEQVISALDEAKQHEQIAGEDAFASMKQPIIRSPAP